MSRQWNFWQTFIFIYILWIGTCFGNSQYLRYRHENRYKQRYTCWYKYRCTQTQTHTQTHTHTESNCKKKRKHVYNTLQVKQQASHTDFLINDEERMSNSLGKKVYFSLMRLTKDQKVWQISITKTARKQYKLVRQFIGGHFWHPLIFLR